MPCTRFTFYLDLASQPARSIAWWRLLNPALARNSIVQPIRIAKREHLTSEFLSINPLGTIPALWDANYGIGLGESGAIIRHICSSVPLQCDSWYVP